MSLDLFVLGVLIQNLHRTCWRCSSYGFCVQIVKALGMGAWGTCSLFVLFICVREMALVEARQWKHGPPPRARGWAITWGQPRGLDLICQKVIDE